MKLDYHAKTGAFTLEVKRGEADPQTLMEEEGLDFWAGGSTPEKAILTTKEPYAAAYWHEHATDAALQVIKPIVARVKESWATDSNAKIAVPDDKELMPFQKASIAYALKRKHCLIGDQPGLGKTPIAICYANEIQAENILLVVPASIRRQWVRRIREWTTKPYGSYLIYNIENGRQGVHPTATWTVVSYDLLRSEPIIKALAKRHYDLLIMDEAHYVKTPESARTRALFGGGENRVAEPLIERSERALALTGTPLPNRPRECFVLARNLFWDSIDFMSERKFRERFNPGARMEGTRADGTTYFYNKEAVGRQGELQMRLRSNFMVRHLKRDVLTQLKLPIYDVVVVDETSAVKKALAAEKLLDIDPDTIETGNFEMLGHVAGARRMMGEAIADQAVEYAKMLLDGGEDKLVVFAWHKSVLDILEKGLQDYGVRRVDGSTSAARKEKIVDEFQTNGRARVVIGNVLSLGTGTDGLQHVCSHCLLVEPDWVPGNNVQAIDRLDRSGQRRTVHAELFVAPRSILERVLTSALRKERTIHKALDRVV